MPRVLGAWSEMNLEPVKLVVYVGRSRRGRWPLSAFVTAARQMALREAVTGALLDDGLGIFHMIEGAEAAVDRFMAFVLLSKRLKDTRVIYETRRAAPMFDGQPLAYCFDASWRERIAMLMAAQPVDRSDLWHFCTGLAERIQHQRGPAAAPPLRREPAWRKDG